MAVNMAYVPKPESDPENDPALKRQCRHSSNFRKGKAIAFLKCLWCSEGLVSGVVIGRKNLFKYNILQENDHAPPQVNC
jgi:hypothetical protein